MSAIARQPLSVFLLLIAGAVVGWVTCAFWVGYKRQVLATIVGPQHREDANAYYADHRVRFPPPVSSSRQNYSIANSQSEMVITTPVSLARSIEEAGDVVFGSRDGAVRPDAASAYRFLIQAGIPSIPTLARQLSSDEEVGAPLALELFPRVRNTALLKTSVTPLQAAKKELAAFAISRIIGSDMVVYSDGREESFKCGLRDRVVAIHSEQQRHWQEVERELQEFISRESTPIPNNTVSSDDAYFVKAAIVIPGAHDSEFMDHRDGGTLIR